MDWFLYDNSLRHERINYFHLKAQSHLFENLPLSRVKLLYQNLELNNQVNRNIPSLSPINEPNGNSPGCKSPREAIW